jgi:stringent starvation protein B
MPDPLAAGGEWRKAIPPMSFRVPSKKQTLLQYLQRGVTMVHLDARRPGVSVPPQYAHDAHLRLNLSYRYSIPDFEIDEHRVQATLSFSGTPFQCVIPWESVFGITSHSGDGQVWPEDLPTEVMQTLGRPERPPAARPGLSAVPRETRAPDRPSAETHDAGRSSDESPRRPHLRLVR